MYFVLDTFLTKMSLFYKSNQAKERKYVKENQLRELNDQAQQEIVEYEISQDLGLDEQATNLGKLAKRVINRLGSEILNAPVGKDVKFTAEQITPMEIIKKSIENGTLTDLFEKLKALPNNILNKTQRIIRNDLSNPDTKRIINDLISEDLANNRGPDAIRQTVLESLGGIGNEDIVLDMIKKTSSSTKYTSEEEKSSVDTISTLLKKKKRIREVKSIEDAQREIDNAMAENEKIIELLQEKEPGKTRKYKIPTKTAERKQLQTKKANNSEKIKKLSEKFKL